MPGLGGPMLDGRLTHGQGAPANNAEACSNIQRSSSLYSMSSGQMSRSAIPQTNDPAMTKAGHLASASPTTRGNSCHLMHALWSGSSIISAQMSTLVWLQPLTKYQFEAWF